MRGNVGDKVLPTLLPAGELIQCVAKTVDIHVVESADGLIKEENFLNIFKIMITFALIANVLIFPDKPPIKLGNPVNTAWPEFRKMLPRCKLPANVIRLV